MQPEEKLKGRKQDPLTNLYQVDDTECSPLDREAAVLITRLLENIEELYVLREQISDVMAVDEKAGTKVVELLNALIRGLRVEESFLRKRDIMPLTYRVTHSFFINSDKPPIF